MIKGEHSYKFTEWLRVFICLVLGQVALCELKLNCQLELLVKQQKKKQILKHQYYWDVKWVFNAQDLFRIHENTTIENVTDKNIVEVLQRQNTHSNTNAILIQY